MVVNRPFGAARLLVAYYGDAPQLLTETCVMGRGLNAEIVGTDWGVNSGEINPPLSIAFARAASGELVVTYHTRDPRQPYEDYNVPFVQETVRLERDGTVRSESMVVLKEEPFDAAWAKSLAESVKAAVQADNMDHLEDILAALRNMGLHSPDKVLPILEDLRKQAGCADGELIDSYQGDIEWVQEMRANSAP
jgi:hypothetical protein